MKYQILNEANEITNVVEWDGTADWSPPADHRIEMVVEPEPDVEAVRKELTDELNALYADRRDGGFVWKNKRFPSGLAWRVDLLHAAFAAARNPDYYAWIERESGPPIRMIASTILDLAKTYHEHVRSCQERRAEQQEVIDGSTSVAALHFDVDI